MYLDLLSDLETLVKAEMTSMGYSPPAGQSLDDLLHNYANLQSRIPPAVAWRVELSQEVASKVLSPEMKQGLEQFIGKAQMGDDLKPYLSTRIRDEEYTDLMFYDWGIFHFHLGTKLDGRGFIERTDDLLFAIADPSQSTLFLIDIHPHKGAFSNQAFLGIIERNWPQVLDAYVLKGVLGVSHHPTDEELAKLREAGVSVILQTPGGRVLAPMGGGITTAGTSVSIRMSVDRVVKTLRVAEEEINKARSQIELETKKHSMGWDDLEFRLTRFGPIVRVEEMKSGLLICNFRF